MSAPPDDRDKLLREMAFNRGCKLVKSRRRRPGAGDYGRYGLKDSGSDREVFGFGPDGLTATAEDIEAFLRKGAVANWKSSLAEASSAANDERTPVPRRARPKPPPRMQGDSTPSPPKVRLRVVQGENPSAPSPPPEPAPGPTPPPPATPAPRDTLRIREAGPADSENIAALLGGEGAGAAARITALRKAGTPPLLADEGGNVVGVVAFHPIALLQSEAPLGRVTFLLVAPAARRRGTGRALLREAEARLTALGCDRVEALAEIELAAAPDFFRRLGWRRSAYRYERPLGK